MQKDVSLKERLVFRRAALNLTQSELAERSGISERSLSDYERGLSQPSIDQLRKLASALSVRTGYLLGEEDIIQADLLAERSKGTDVVGYSHIESDTLARIMSEMSAKLPKLSEHERKHVLGNLRTILDVLEDRELGTAQPPAQQKISSAPPSPEVEKALGSASEAQRLARESLTEQNTGSPSDNKSGPGGGNRGRRGR